MHCYTIRYKLKMLKGNARSFQLIRLGLVLARLVYRASCLINQDGIYMLYYCSLFLPYIN